MKIKIKKTVNIFIRKTSATLLMMFLIMLNVTPTVWADPVPVFDEFLNKLVGEIVGPVYQLATPGSDLTKDIYRQLMKYTETELGIDKDFFRRMEKKQEAPTVDIVFAPTNPKEGEKVTAFAIPHNFKNSKENLYFTWYIVHDVVEGDEKPDVEAGKREAMRMMAAGNYDKNLFFGDTEPKDIDKNRDAYDASFGGDDGVGKKEAAGTAAEEDCEECDCLDDMTMMKDEITRGCFDDKGELLYANYDEFMAMVDEDGEERAVLGRGVVNSEWITRCYRHNFGAGGDLGSKDKGTFSYSGRDLIIKCQHAFGDGIGDREFKKTEEEDWGTNPEDPDTDGDGTMDEADLAGLGQDEFTWIYRKGDKVSVVVEGTSKIPINEGATTRLRYKATVDEEGEGRDSSPLTSPESWYPDVRSECEEKMEDGPAAYSDCMKVLWEKQRSETNDEDAFGDMTGYYKIMWAAPGICSEHKKDEAENDWCDTDDDIGFQYLKLYDPAEQSKQLLEVSISISPKNPQFSEPDANISHNASVQYGDSTDMIIASANVVGERNLNPDYLYYKWTVWSCEPDDFDVCHDVTSQVDWQSYKEGMGVRDVGFYPTPGVFEFGDKALLKIGVVVKRHKNEVMSSPGVNGEYAEQIFSEEKKEKYNTPREYPNKYAYTASKLVEVVKHNIRIKLYQARPTGDGGWMRDKEICQGGLYKTLCPVFPYQVLMAEVENADGGAVSWKLNGRSIGPSYNDAVNGESNSTTVFFPIIGKENSLGRITATVEKVDEDLDSNIVEERIFSIHSPMAKITDLAGNLRVGRLQKARNGAGVVLNANNQELWWALAPEATSNKDYFIVDIPMQVIPEYLIDEINGASTQVYQGVYAPVTVAGAFTMVLYVDGDFKGALESSDEGDSWAFNNVGFHNDIGTVHDAKIETIKVFSDDYKKALYKTFAISPEDELVDVKNFKIELIDAETYTERTGRTVERRTGFNLRKVGGEFLASTVDNAPAYLLFIIRLAVGMVLVSVVTFGILRYEK